MEESFGWCLAHHRLRGGAACSARSGLRGLRGPAGAFGHGAFLDHRAAIVTVELPGSTGGSRASEAACQGHPGSEDEAASNGDEDEAAENGGEGEAAMVLPAVIPPEARR